jgi:cyclomaltodextrinase / maltogenic alpha-amylase / neopullulanase
VRSRISRSRSFPDDLGVYGLPGDVSPWRVDFDPADRAFLDRESDDHFRVRVWAEPALEEAMLVERSGEVRGFPLEAVGSEGLREAVVPLRAGAGISLAFRTREGRPVYQTRQGIAVAVERLDRWTVPALEPQHVPAWAQGALIYQIFPDRFAKGDPGTDPAGTEPWGTTPTPRSFQGGDLTGIAQRLDYLIDLGVELIYLNPVFTSPSNHRYDTVDYYVVDPVHGGNEALRKLVEEVHARGLRLILDVSFNHCHPRFFAFADLVEKGSDSPYRDWFAVHDWPVRIRTRETGDDIAWPQQSGLEDLGVPIEKTAGPGPAVEPSYDTWYGVASMPRINLAHPEARRYFLEVAAYWVREFGIDGWRMDVARYIDPDFWVDLRRVVKRENPEAYLISEVMGDAGPWLQGDAFDATMNYVFRQLCLRFLADESDDAEGFLAGLTRLYGLYSRPALLASQSLIGSHDTPRFRTEAGGALWRLRLATVLQLTFPGAPGIYYGDELGMEGGPEPGSRAAFPTEIEPEEVEPLQTIRSLTALRRSESALRLGEWRPLLARGGLVAFERWSGRRRLVVAVNRGSRAARVPLPGRGRILWGEGEMEVEDLRVPGRQATVVALGGRR